MERVRRSQPQVTPHMLTALPFGGLGHDLSAAEARATLLELVPHLPDEYAACANFFHMPHVESAPRLSGFALLVALGREIRGR